MKFEVSALKQKTVKFWFEEHAKELGLKIEGVGFESTVKAEMEIVPQKENFVGRVKVETQVRLECSRCLRIYSFPLRAEFDLFMEKQTGDLAVVPEDEDVVLIKPQDKFVDIGDRVRQFVALNVPLKPLCSPSCRGLCHTCGTNLNTSACDCTTEKHDGRWEKLKQVFKRGEE